MEASATVLAGVAAAAGDALVAAVLGGKKILCFGNGGSATQASHMAGELIGRFKETRRPYAAVALGGDVGSVTCIANDFGYGALYERQVEGLASVGDVLIGLTTSGSSENVVRGLAMGRKNGAVTIALTGRNGLRGADADHVLAVPSDVTAHIQEVHLMLLHAWCVEIDAHVLGRR
ncbi:MAG: SIS domain-containing protein [Gemmatimonadota bacterium]|nr:SIS domain-containing protein [Gemmatimonadota bacterium]